jgi:hypothetical protein
MWFFWSLPPTQLGLNRHEPLAPGGLLHFRTPLPSTPLRIAFRTSLNKGLCSPPASEHWVSYCHSGVWVESVPFDVVEERADVAASFGSGRGGVGGGAEASSETAGWGAVMASISYTMKRATRKILCVQFKVLSTKLSSSHCTKFPKHLHSPSYCNLYSKGEKGEIGKNKWR